MPRDAANHAPRRSHALPGFPEGPVGPPGCPVSGVRCPVSASPYAGAFDRTAPPCASPDARRGRSRTARTTPTARRAAGGGASASIHVSVQARIRAFPSVCGPPDPGSAHRFPPADAVRAGAVGPPGAGRQAAAGADLSSHMRRSRGRTFAVTTGPPMTAVTAAPGALPFPGAARTAPSSPGRTCRRPSPPCTARPPDACVRRRCGARP